MGFQSLPILVSDIETLVDPLNSSTIPLVANATFTGVFNTLLSFPVVDVTIITDQPGTLFVDVSSDGVTVAQTSSFAVTNTLLFRSPFSWQYIRLRYTNGITAQTTFFLQFLLRPSDPGLPALPLSHGVSINSPAPLNRSVLIGQTPLGTFQNLQCDASNVLLVDVSNFPATQPVSGTVTANIGTTGGLALDSSLTTIDTDIKTSQPRKLQDGSGNALTSQVNGAQRALDIGIDVAGVQIDPRQVRTLTSSDVVTANQGGAPWSQNVTQIAGNSISTAASGIAKIGLTDGSGNAVTSTVINSKQRLDINVPSSTTPGSAVPSHSDAVGGKDSSGNLQTLSVDASIGALMGDLATYYVGQAKGFTLTTEVNLPTNGTETRSVLITNPNGSGKTMHIAQISFGLVTAGNNQIVCRIYKGPTISANGTAATPTNDNVGSAVASSVNAFTAPTITANGTKMRTIILGGATAADSIIFNCALIVQANNSILITGQPNGNNLVQSVNITWVEI